jgi:hypothetical protein
VARERVTLAEYTATRLVYDLSSDHPFFMQQTFSDLMERINRSPITDRTRQQLQQLLRCVTEAAARVYGEQAEERTRRSPFFPLLFYMGSGVILALEALAIEQCWAAPVNLGMRPQPFVAAVLQQVPVYGDPTPGVVTTVDGAAILASVAVHFGPLPAMTMTQTGYGAAVHEATGTMQGVQVLLGEAASTPAADRIAVLETNIDDMNPEFYEVVFERLFAAGALDVTLTPLLMKKGRPANQLTVLSPLPAVSRLSRLILQETSTFGVRIYEVWRQKLERFSRPVDTRYGSIAVKCGVLDGHIVQAAPEYDVCKRAAQEHGVPVRLVYSEAARQAAAWLV